MAVFTKGLQQRRFCLMDGMLLCLLFVVLYAVLKLGAGMGVSFSPEQRPVIDLDPLGLPYYAGRSLLRMFIAFGASLIFTIFYGYVAAKSRTARKVMVPLLDILQSVPVLGFLSATIVAFMAFFPGSLLGVECASILAIFTGQAWNMTFSFYHSLITIPKDLQEASDMLHLNWWQRFVHLELPVSAISLIWNGMMSFGGGWFFLAASEAITVLGEDIHLPGVGSYLAAAVDAGDISAMLYAMAAMLLMIFLVDQFFWRPLVVWGQRFKLELSESETQPVSFIYDLLHGSWLVNQIFRWSIYPAARGFNRFMDTVANITESGMQVAEVRWKGEWLRSVFWGLLGLFICYMLYRPVIGAFSMLYGIGTSGIIEALHLGFLTWLRVMAALVLGALWTIPAGVWIGMNPRLAEKLQPVVQMAAAFPANMIFPLLIIVFVNLNVNFEYGSVLLMMLGTQWYILFNVIAGAMSLPNDMLEAAAVFKIHGWKKWKSVILPGIFPQLVTGFVTASGGAWNASIVSEIAGWKDIDLTATGIGAYINLATAAGDWPKIVLGITAMCVFVVTINRLVWGRLYKLAETKYHLD
jgi:NitT/TauT family transport system permease protein